MTPMLEKSALRIPPQSLEGERALLGSIMLRPDAMADVLDIVSAESFYSDKHRLVFETMLDLHRKSDPIDLLSLSSKLSEKGRLDAVGGAGYLTELVNTVPSSSNIEYYAEIVHKKHALRMLIQAGDFVSNLGYSEAEELEETLDKAEKSIFDVTSSPGTHKFVEIKLMLAEAWERFEKLNASESGVRGVPTGFQALDNKLSGFQPSDLIILAARPSVGKTAFALDIARRTATRHNTSVGIFSLEMSHQQLIDRMLATESQVDAWKLRTGLIKDGQDFTNFRNALDRLSTAPIYIDDQPANNILKMRAVARRLKSQHGLGLIVVDYLQLMVPATKYKSQDSMVQQVTEISRSLKQLARELDVPVLALSQLSRDVEKRGGRPRLSDLRDSGSIEQDADLVMFIHRKDREGSETAGTAPTTAEIIIAKHRNGPTGEIELQFDPKTATFYESAHGSFADF
jgi:replicative DNA helicase